MEEDPKWIPEEYRCPISREVMKDPVVIDTGRTYEKEVIL